MTSSSVCATRVCFSGYLFTGKERDTESGNDYFGARYYASNTGRFMSPDFNDDDDDPDPVPYADLRNPQSLNLYGYVNNNPLSRADADGHDCPVCDELVAGMEAGAEEGEGAGPEGVVIGAGTGLLFAGADLLWNTFHSSTPSLQHPGTVNPPQPDAAHRKDARPSTKGKHQKGQGRKKKDQGGEKGDVSRQANGMYGRKPPPNWKGSWPPKDNNNNGFIPIVTDDRDKSSVTTSQHDNLPVPPPPPPPPPVPQPQPQ